MIRLLHRLFHRPVKEPETTPAMQRAIEVNQEVERAEQRINRTISELQRRDSGHRQAIGEDGFIGEGVFPRPPRQQRGHS